MLRVRRPAQIGTREHKTDDIPVQSMPPARPQHQQQTEQHRQRVKRIDDENAAQTIRCRRAGQQQLRAIDGHGIETGVGNQHQPDHQPPAQIMIHAATGSGHYQCNQRRGQRLIKQRMGFAAMANHVGNAIAVVNERVQIGQGSDNGAHQRTFPERL